MDKIRVHSGKRLNGSINVYSSKNALLPILASTIICNGEVELDKVPDFLDIKKMCDILVSLGAGVLQTDDNLYISCQNINKYFIDNELGKDLRSSIVMLGALLSRFKCAVVGYPGGCNIGSRPIDLHLFGLKKLGVKITEEHGYLFCDGRNMKPATIIFEKQSVGATQNLILASVLLKGKTILKNVAKEPEVVDLANFLNKMGARVLGAGTNTITIEGVLNLHGATHTAIPDRIVAGTYLVATAIAGGNVEICNIIPQHILPVLKKLSVCGCNLTTKNDKIAICSSKRNKCLKSITTGVYPKFPTDMQSIFLSLMAVSEGSTLITENLFDGRFKQVPELNKMGADIKVFCNKAKVKGVKTLSGADVSATDLRAAAGLVLCGLVADGYTTISNVNYLDRGYDHLEDSLKTLGANIERI